MNLPRKVERKLLVLGLFLLAFYAAGRIRGQVLSRAEVQRFQSHQTYDSTSFQPAVGLTDSRVTTPPDFVRWSSKRIREFRESLALQYPPALAVLRIPKIQLEVPVLEGTDELTLNRGVGRILNTAYPGAKDGNVGIAGHRDGFFRGLKDIGPGDQIQVVLRERTENYVVDRILIVSPSDVSVLQPRPRPSLTLVTCYPFHFIGSAPRRYIVQATLAGSDGGAKPPSGSQSNAQSAK